MSEDIKYAVQQIAAWARGVQAAAVAAGEESLPADVRSAIWTVADAADDHEDPDRCQAGIRALFADLVEPCNDALDAAGRQAYAAFFPAVLWRVALGAKEIRERLRYYGINGEQDCYRHYARRRQRGNPTAASAPLLPDIVERIAVLSRVTIGADILLTSVVCQRLHQAFPGAEIVILGDGKLEGLLAGLPQVRVYPISYQRRGPLRARLDSWLRVLDALDDIDAHLVLSPDSRLDQLGILPVTEDETDYLLWENTLPPTAQSLATLVDDWCSWALGLDAGPACVPTIALSPELSAQAQGWQQRLKGQPTIAMKFDHGGNPAKSLPAAVELVLVRQALAAGWRVVLDRGFGASEYAASDALIAQLKQGVLDVDEGGELAPLPSAISDGEWQGAQLLRFHGSIAGWAAVVSAASAALSYDSVGHHLAAALGVPLLSIFTGHQHQDFPVAWSPCGRGPVQQVVIPTAERGDGHWQQEVCTALARLLADHQ